MEHDDGAPRGIESAQGVVDDLSIGHVGSDIADRRLTNWMELQLDGPAPPTTQDVDTGTNEQPMQPGVEPIRVAEAGEVSPGGDQGVLDRVSREFAVPEDQT